MQLSLMTKTADKYYPVYQAYIVLCVPAWNWRYMCAVR